MKRRPGQIFNAIAILSLILLVVNIVTLMLTGIDEDFAIFWTWHGDLYSFDTFEDIQPVNAFTFRRFDNWPASVHLQLVVSCVEGGTEVPSPLGTGQAMQASVDANSQPRSQTDPNGHLIGPMAVDTLFEMPRCEVITIPLTVLILIAWLLRPVVRRYLRSRRKVDGLCPSCGYDLRATLERCPECGLIAGAKNDQPSPPSTY